MISLFLPLDWHGWQLHYYLILNFKKEFMKRRKRRRGQIKIRILEEEIKKKQSVQAEKWRERRKEEERGEKKEN